MKKNMWLKKVMAIIMTVAIILSTTPSLLYASDMDEVSGDLTAQEETVVLAETPDEAQVEEALIEPVTPEAVAPVETAAPIAPVETATPIAPVEIVAEDSEQPKAPVDKKEQQTVETVLNTAATDAPIVNQTTKVSYSTLAAALVAAQAGDVIELSEGTFAATANEQLRIEVPNLTLQGQGIDKTMINAGGYSCSGQAGIYVCADNVTIRDLSVNSTAGSGVSALKYVLKDAAKPLAGGLVERVKIFSQSSHALNVHGVDGMVIDGVVVEHNGKLSFSFASSPAISVSNVTTCASAWGADIGIMYGDAASGLYAYPTVVTLGEGNHFYHDAFYSEKRAEKDDDQIISTTKTLYKVDAGATYCYQDSAVCNQTTKRNYSTLVAALAAAQAGDTLELSKGTFAATANEQLRIEVPNLTIQGAGAAQTTIDAGEFSCSGQAGVMVCADNVTIRDLTVRSASSNRDVSALKYVLKDGSEPLAGGHVEHVDVYGKSGHGVNIHGVNGMTIDYVNIKSNGKLSFSFANSPAISVSHVTTCESPWKADIGIMYDGNKPAMYEHPTVVTLGADNQFQHNVFYSEKRTQNDDDTIKTSAGALYKVAVGEQYNYQSVEPAVCTQRSGKTIYYNDIKSALAGAKDGDVILVADGTYVDRVELNSNTCKAKNVTLKAKQSAVLSGGISGSGVIENFTIDGFTFNTNPINGTWCSTIGTTLTVRNCTFNNVTVPGNKLGSISIGSSTAGPKRNFVITGNTIIGGCGVVEPIGVYIQNGNNITFTNNTLTNIIGTGINFSQNMAGTVTITGNTFTNWAVGNDTAPGRAMRLQGSSAVIKWVINENSMSRGIGAESFVKLTDVSATSTVSLLNNYWGGFNPATVKSTDGNLLAEVPNYELIYPYYSDAKLQTLKFDEVATIIPAIIVNLEKVISADGTFHLSAVLTDEQAKTITQDETLKNAIVSAMDQFLRLDVTGAQAFLDKPAHQSQKAAIENLKSLYKVAVTIKTEVKAESKIDTEQTAVVLTQEVQKSVPENLKQQVTEETIKETLETIANQITHNTVVQPTTGEITNALRTAMTENATVAIKAVLEDVKLGTVVKDETVTVVPESIVYEISPFITTGDAGDAEETPLTNSLLNGSPIVFRVAIPNMITDTYATVIHSGAIDGDIYEEDTKDYPILSDDDGNQYIEIQVTHFSFFKLNFYTPTETLQPENPTPQPEKPTPQPENPTPQPGKPKPTSPTPTADKNGLGSSGDDKKANLNNESTPKTIKNTTPEKGIGSTPVPPAEPKTPTGNKTTRTATTGGTSTAVKKASSTVKKTEDTKKPEEKTAEVIEEESNLVASENSTLSAKSSDQKVEKSDTPLVNASKPATTSPIWVVIPVVIVLALAVAFVIYRRRTNGIR